MLPPESSDFCDTLYTLWIALTSTAVSITRIYTVIPPPTRETRGVITACWAKQLCANSLWGKNRVTWTLALKDPAMPSLKIHTYLYSKHLHSASVADAASFRGGWVSNRRRLSARYFNFSAFGIFPQYIFNFFKSGRLILSDFGRGGSINSRLHKTLSFPQEVCTARFCPNTLWSLSLTPTFHEGSV